MQCPSFPAEGVSSAGLTAALHSWNWDFSGRWANPYSAPILHGKGHFPFPPQNQRWCVHVSVLTHSHLLVPVCSVCLCVRTHQVCFDCVRGKRRARGGCRQKQRLQCLVLQSWAQKNRKDGDPFLQTSRSRSLWRLENEEVLFGHCSSDPSSSGR